MITITRFESLTDVHGARCPLSSWGELMAHPATTETKETRGWSPALFEGDRRGSAVTSVAALVLDHDDGTPLDRIAEVWGDSWALVHSTWSHSPARPKFRVILPLDRPATPSEHAILWQWAFARDPHIDASCKDCGRYWYVASHRPGAIYEWCELSGAVLDVDRWVAENCRVTQPFVSKLRAESGHNGYDLRTGKDGKTYRPTPGPHSVLTRARAYLACMPESISGSGGHLALWGATLALVRGFGLSDAQTFDLLAAEFNPRCKPPWSEREIRHKIKQAIANGQRPWGYIVDRRVA